MLARSLMATACLPANVPAAPTLETLRSWRQATHPCAAAGSPRHREPGVRPSRTASGAVVLQPCHEVAEEHSNHAAVAAPRLLTLRIVELLDQGRQTRRPQFGGPAWPAPPRSQTPGSIPRRVPTVTLSPSTNPGFLGCDAEWPCDRPVLISSPNTRRRGNCSVRASSKRRVFSVIRVRQRAEITRFSRREMLPLAAGRRRTSMPVRVHAPPRCHHRPRCRRLALR